MQGRKAIAIGGLAAALAFIAGGLWSLAGRHETAPVISQPITVCHPWTIGLLVALAAAEDMFHEEGVTVTLERQDSGAEALQAMLAGECELATVGDTPVVFSTLRGEGISILAATNVRPNHNRVVARADRGIARPLDLRGKRIAVLPTTTADFFLYRFLFDRGVEPRDVEILRVGGMPSLQEAFEEGRVDAVAISEPHAGRLRAALGERAIEFQAPGLVATVSFLVATPDAVRQRGEAITRMLRALQRAADFAARDPDAAKASVAAQVGQAVDEVAANWGPSNAFRVALDQSLLPLLEDEARWAMETGLAARQPTPNFLDAFDFAPLDRALPGSVTVFR